MVPRPENDYQALMETRPFEEPKESNDDLLYLRDVVAEYVDQLDERELWIVNAFISERKSLQAIADELGFSKTHVWRLRNEAFDKLKHAMTMNPTIRERIQMAETWEQAAGQWVMHLASQEGKEFSVESLIEWKDWMADCVTHNDPPGNNLFSAMATMCINELRKTGQWDSGDMVRLLCSKQHDYGHGNINAFGLFGIVVRLSDKVERYKNLISKKSEAQNEPLLDTLNDIVGYCVIAIMFNEKTFQLQLGGFYGN